MDLTYINEWLVGLSASYNVNPYIFAAVYLGTIPFFTLSIAWLVRNKKRERPLTLPILSTGFFFSISYLYLLVAGENVPLWVYGVVSVILGFGCYVTWFKIARKVNEAVNTDARPNDC